MIVGLGGEGVGVYVVCGNVGFVVDYDLVELFYWMVVVIVGVGWCDME